MDSLGNLNHGIQSDEVEIGRAPCGNNWIRGSKPEHDNYFRELIQM